MADHRLRCPVEELSQWVRDAAVNAAMLMTHSVPMDAQSLSAVAGCDLDYVGLLGPTHRREEVFVEAGLNDDNTSLVSMVLPDLISAANCPKA